MRNLLKTRKLWLGIALVLIIATSLWFSVPTQAINITLPSLPASGTTGATYNFTVKVDISESELLPVQSIYLYIYKSDDRAHYEAICADLPLGSGSRVYSSTETGGGAINVAATGGPGWTLNYGYGYASWQGYAYYFFQPGGYGYGYGYQGGITSITYNLAWSVPQNWPAGSYKIEVKLNADGNTFTKTSTIFSLGASDGGGGGGGGGIPPGYTYLIEYVGAGGVFSTDAGTRSSDGRANLIIPKNTKFLTREGYPGSFVSMVEMPKEDQPSPTPGANVIGLMYSLGPDGATFDPPIVLTLLYDESLIPAGINEKDLAIAYWDKSAGKWIVLENCTVDVEKNIITAQVSHFTPFAVLGYKPEPTSTPAPAPTPATFSITNLGVFPAEIKVGEEVTVSALVTNTGDIAGSYLVTLEVDNKPAYSRQVTLAGKASEKVSFTVPGAVAKTYQVNIKGLSTAFIVKESPPVTPPPVPAAFTISNLTVSPDPVYDNQEMTIEVLVANTGSLSGTYRVSLLIDNKPVATKDITLDGKTTRKVTFTTVVNTAGIHSVDVSGLYGTFVIKASGVPASPSPWLIGAIIGAIIAVAAGIALAIRHSRNRFAI